ncbi:MAG: response regulator [Deltaproteobacteria bacterium]|nr:response regulator [Deltaproteobacteria bacterium]
MTKVLVIDDEPDLRFLIGEYLDDLGYEVIEAPDGRIGLEKIFSDEPDIVLSDLRMPEMDGLEVLKRIAPEKPELPFLVISGAGGMNDAIEALRRGAWDYIVKPIKSPDVLQHTITRALERAQLLKIKKEYQESLESKFREGQKKLKESRESLDVKSGVLETLFQNVPMGLYYLNTEGVFLDVNPALTRILGKSREAMIGRSLKHFPELSSLPGLDAEADGGLQVRRLKVQDKSFELAFQQSVIRSPEGRILGWVGFVLDVTEQLKAARDAKKQEQQLLQADKMISLGILTAGVAHEINNPTQVIMSNAPIARRAWADILPVLDCHADEKGDFPIAGMPYSRMKEKFGELLLSIEDGAERIKAIIHSMKDFARLDPEDDRRMVDINSIIEASLHLVNSKVKKCCRQLRINLDRSIPRVKANGRQLEQVFVNLILNAAEALPAPDRAMEITSAFNSITEKLMVEFRDEGDGISPDVMKNIFDPFFTTKRDIGGTGLGLAISNRIIQKHGGEIVFDSKKGKGTTVTVVLPYLNPDWNQGENR